MNAKPGDISWIDLTIPNADEVRDFYAAVCGWQPQTTSMGDYNDYCMLPPGSETPVAGICHNRGSNADLPPQWLIYITVENLAASLEQVEAQGGTILHHREEGSHRFAVIRDPAGAVAALYQPAPDA